MLERYPAALNKFKVLSILFFSVALFGAFGGGMRYKRKFQHWRVCQHARNYSTVRGTKGHLAQLEHEACLRLVRLRGWGGQR